jgi:hypothetical protein
LGSEHVEPSKPTLEILWLNFRTKSLKNKHQSFKFYAERTEKLKLKTQNSRRILTVFKNGPILFQLRSLKLSRILFFQIFFGLGQFVLRMHLPFAALMKFFSQKHPCLQTAGPMGFGFAQEGSTDGPQTE